MPKEHLNRAILEAKLLIVNVIGLLISTLTQGLVFEILANLGALLFIREVVYVLFL